MESTPLKIKEKKREIVVLFETELKKSREELGILGQNSLEQVERQLSVCYDR